MTPVTIFVFVNPGSQVPLENVIIRIYSEDGSTFVTEVETDETGEVTFDLPDLTTYWVRLFKPGYRFPVRAQIQVNSGLPNNAFDIEAINLTELASSPYSGLCRISGTVVDPAGTPASGVSMRFEMTQEGNPRVYHDRPIIPQTVFVRSLDDGYVEFDLIQGGLYEVTYEGIVGYDYSGFTREVRVPETQAMGLADLVWPYILSATFSPDALSMTPGAQQTVDFTVYLSNLLQFPIKFVETSVDMFSFLRVVDDGGGSAIKWDSGTRQYTVTAGASGTTTVFSVYLIPATTAERVPAPTSTLGTLTVTVA
jgi:hypothetical protein